MVADRLATLRDGQRKSAAPIGTASRVRDRPAARRLSIS